jgi:hypothetical protein
MSRESLTDAVYARIKEKVAGGGKDGKRIAESVVRGLDDRTLRALAYSCLSDWAWTVIRADQRAVERAAMQAEVDVQREEWSERAEQDRRWQALKRGAQWAWKAITPEEKARWDEWRAVEDEWERKKVESLNRIIGDFMATMRVQWTEELLGSEFALGDGRRVSFGDATVADHRKRVDMQTGLAMAELQDAALHEAAIAVLDETGAACLNDVPEELRAAA